MKKLFLFILVITTISARSQTTISDWDKIYIVANPNPFHDTAQIIMLVCDTLHHAPMAGRFTRYSDSTRIMRIYPNPPVYWLYGYNVTRWAGGRVEGDTYVVNEGEFYTVHVKYLDINKKPLPTGLVVWMSVKLEE